MKKLNLAGFGRRQVTLLSLVVLIAVAGYINLTQKDEEVVPASGGAVITDTPQQTAQPDDYFSLSRYERDKSRSAAMAVYREVVSNKDSGKEAKDAAQASLTAAAAAMEAETVIEGLIRAKGFEEALVYINADSASVVVKTIGLTPAQAAQIKDLVKENANISAEKTKIIEIK